VTVAESAAEADTGICVCKSVKASSV